MQDYKGITRGSLYIEESTQERYKIVNFSTWNEPGASDPLVSYKKAEEGLFSFVGSYVTASPSGSVNDELALNPIKTVSIKWFQELIEVNGKQVSRFRLVNDDSIPPPPF